MPANLPPQYKEAEQRFREAKSHEERLEALREMMALLPKHKGTDKLQADLKHRISKLEEEGEHAKHGGARHFDPGHVRREGAGQWALIGPPNAGKSALLKALTHAHPEVAPYPFTTHAPQPGMMPFEDLQVQLVDTPAVTAQHALLERSHVWPAARPLPADAPPFLLQRPVLAAGNKCDLDPGGTLAALARDALGPGMPFLPVSAERGTGLDELRRALFAELRRIRIYAKEPGKKPDL